jgi:nitrate reductase NapD
MNVSGILVVVPPGQLSTSIETLNGLDGVDVHYSDPDSGRIVVTQEADNIAAEVEGLKRIKALPHVILAEMVYHCFEDDSEIIATLPAEFSEAGSGACVPPYLNKS